MKRTPFGQHIECSLTVEKHVFTHPDSTEYDGTITTVRGSLSYPSVSSGAASSGVVQ